MTRLLALAVGLGLFAGCQEITTCDYQTKDDVDPSIGALPTEVVGCWQTLTDFGTLVVYEYLPDGTFRYIENPNQLSPNGVRFEGGYLFRGQQLLMDGVSSSYNAAITPTSLRLSYSDGSGLAIAMRRAVCRGFGFDQSVDVRCPNAP